MSETKPEERCRLVLIVPEAMVSSLRSDELASILDGGDVASLIIPRYALDDDAYQNALEALCPPAQERGIAVIGTGEKRVLARAGADGVHLTLGASEVRSYVETQQDNMIIGATAGQSRHAALEMGEARPDYVFFGKFGGDVKPEPHPKLVELSTWWAQMVEIPAILLAGNDVATLEIAASTGVDFVALSSAVFEAENGDAQAVVRHANAILEHYPLAHAD